MCLSWASTVALTILSTRSRIESGIDTNLEQNNEISFKIKNRKKYVHKFLLTMIVRFEMMFRYLGTNDRIGLLADGFIFIVRHQISVHPIFNGGFFIFDAVNHLLWNGV